MNRLNKLYESVNKEQDNWHYKIDSDGAHYTKINGAEQWHVSLKNGKVVKAVKVIDGDKFPLDKEVVDKLLKRVKTK